MEEETQTVTVNPLNEGVQMILANLVDGFPELDEASDDQMAQFLADLVTASVVFTKEGGDMKPEDYISIFHLAYKQLEGFEGTTQ